MFQPWHVRKMGMKWYFSSGNLRRRWVKWCFSSGNLSTTGMKWCFSHDKLRRRWVKRCSSSGRLSRIPPPIPNCSLLSLLCFAPPQVSLTQIWGVEGADPSTQTIPDPSPCNPSRQTWEIWGFQDFSLSSPQSGASPGVSAQGAEFCLLLHFLGGTNHTLHGWGGDGTSWGLSSCTGKTLDHFLPKEHTNISAGSISH